MIIIGVVIFSYVKNIPIVKFFWNSFTDNMTRMHNGQLNDWQLAAPITVFNTPH
ncbi:MAG: hypothetical protein NTZ44_03885 [Candidatus Nomurabacteria bacterium]|nr:hypothetical protein [Candidatus Nomurabacteria bacterium]